MRGVASAGIVLLLVALGPSAAPEPVSDDEKVLQANRIPIDGPGLLGYVRKRFTSPLTEAKIKELIELLGDDSFEKREEASRALILAGTPGKKLLQDALRNDDLEVRHRAELCLRQIENNALATQLTATALRVLAKRKPAGAAEFLLSQWPTLQAEPIAPAIRDALVGLAIRDGKAEPALVAGLSHNQPLKRSAAALSLIRARASDQLPALRKLLADPDREVRLDVALALAYWKQKEAIPVLIADLDQPITPRYGQIEEVLFRLAGDKSPTLSDSDRTARRNYRSAWQDWWKDSASDVNLAVLAEREKLLERTLIVLLDENQVLALDADNKVRWKIDGIEMPLDIQPLPGDRVLLAEYKGNRVTERNSKGKVVWERKVPEPLMAQRLSNGHTLIATKNQLVEVDASGKEIFTYTPEGGAEIMRARKLPGGDMVLVTQLGVTHLVRIDRFGKVLKRFGVDVGTSGGRLDVSLAGNVLIPEMYSNRIAEYDADGKIVRVIGAQQPIACVSLPNGNVVVTSMTQKRAVELDRMNKEVWEYRRDTRVTRAVRY